MDLLSAHPELAPRFFKLMSDSLSESREKAKELEGRCAQADATAEMHARDLAAMVEENRRLADALAAAQVKREPESGADLTLLHAEHEDEISTLRSAKDAIIQEMSQEREELQTALDKLREKHEDQSRELKTWQADFNALNDQLTRETKELRDLKDIMEENAAALKAIADKLCKAEADGGQAELACSELSDNVERQQIELDQHKADIQNLCGRHQAQLKDLREKAKATQDRLKVDNAALKGENSRIKAEMNAKIDQSEAQDRALKEMEHKYETEMAKNAELQVEFSKSTLKYENSVREYMDMAMKSNTLVKEYEQKIANASATDAIEKAALLKLTDEKTQETEKLVQNMEMEHAAHAARVKEHADKNLQLHRDLDSLRGVVPSGKVNPPECKVPNSEPVKEETPTICAAPLNEGLAEYCRIMGTLPHPPYRPPLGGAVGRVSGPLDYFEHNIPTKRTSAHFPLQQMWSSPHFVHALAFGPMKQYRSSAKQRGVPPCLESLCGNVCDLFVTGQGKYIYYAGIYFVHSLRHVNPSSSVVPPDVAPEAIQRAIMAAGKTGGAPIPNHELKTECFGLQCIGFDVQLHETLRKAFDASPNGNKRKATGDPRDDLRAKSQKTQ